MAETTYTLVDVSGAVPTPIEPWNPVLVTREAIEQEI